MRSLHPEYTACPDPGLERSLRRIVLVGLLLVLALPAARGSSAWLGAGPLWLLGMPLASWWALHRFQLPSLRRPVIASLVHRRWRGAAQARRRGTMRPRRIAHAA